MVRINLLNRFQQLDHEWLNFKKTVKISYPQIYDKKSDFQRLIKKYCKEKI